MSVVSLLVVALVIIFVWVGILTIILFKIRSHYNALIKGADKQNLQTVLDTILKEVGLAKNELAIVSEKCDKIEKDGLLHIQKIGLLRFNPFKDTGGDQSFILALVDATDTGVVISGLYSRSGTRWYAKKVVAGKGLEYELSADEKKSLNLAKTTGKYYDKK